MTQRTDTLKTGLLARATRHHIAAWHYSSFEANAWMRQDHFIDLARKPQAARGWL